MASPEADPHALFARYQPLAGSYDEFISNEGTPRAHALTAIRLLTSLGATELGRCQALAEKALISGGVTFNVYSDKRGAEKILPFCMIPRVIGAAEWGRVEIGLVQRLRALEMFLDDVYGKQRILKEGVIPADMVLGAKHFIPKLHGLRPPGGVRIHIAGIDLIRDPEGTFRVLEDNLRTPSGVSYVLENRLITKRVLPQALEQLGVRQVGQYAAQLADSLRSVAPNQPEDANVVLLTPGRYNAAYFEHTFLARMMGIELVEPSDLVVDADTVYMRTTRGPQRVDVIYRRIDDDYLDPEFFRPDSVLGVPGLMRAYAAGKVALANAPGNGVCDDKAVYPFVPAMIKYYLGEEAKLEQVRTFVCAREEDRRYVLERLPQLVVKAVDEAGGNGMLMGPQASGAECAEFRDRINAEPRRYIAQHRVELSTCPTWDPSTLDLVPRRVDLRPFILTRSSPSAPSSWVLPGGLTRVALRPGSYVVNSSQGGGSKDTWVQKAAT